MEKMRNAYRILVENWEERARRNWDDNIKMDLKRNRV
jgi:hypothetical protein